VTSGPARLKLLLVVHSIDVRAGMEVQVAHLAGGLVESGHQVCLASIGTREDLQGPRPGPPVDSRVRVVHLGAGSRGEKVAAVRRLARLARASDLVHCTGWDASLWGRLAAIAAQRPVIVAEHTPGRDHQVSSAGAPRQRLIALHNRVLDPFTAHTVICAEWQRGLMRSEGVAARKLVHVPNGVPVAELRERAHADLDRAALGIPESAKLIAHVARFAPQKRQLLALETTARLRESLGDVRIVFAGEGGELERVRAVANERGADWAIFLGRHPNPPAVFGLADLAVLPSSGEALPMVVLEAIAVGTPMVATDVGDVGTVLRSTGAGIAVPVDDPEAFFRACADVLRDDDLRRRLGAAAQDAGADIDAATMVGRYERIFRSVLSRNGDAPLEV
jgi:glycosyltransferase involved in cell wall biosynthesis